MEGPIISPWLVYLINASLGIRISLIFIGSLLLVLAWSLYTNSDTTFVWSDSYRDQELSKKYKRTKNVTIAIAVLVLLTAFLIPSKNTCYQMLAAHYMTYENVDALGGQAKEVVDYIFDKVDEVSSGEKEDE